MWLLLMKTNHCHQCYGQIGSGHVLTAHKDYPTDNCRLLREGLQGKNLRQEALLSLRFPILLQCLA